MKIIKDGNPYPRIFDCKICGCKFEANRREYAMVDYTPQSDIQDIRNMMLESPQERARHMKLECACPCCGDRIEIPYIESEESPC